MKEIKLIAVDLGGSLLSDDNRISIDNINAIKLAKQKGIKIALITARMYSSTKYISNMIDADYGIFGNGACVIDLKNNNPIYVEYVPKDLSMKLVDFAKKKKIYIHLNRLYYETSDKNEYFALKHTILNNDYPESLKTNIEIVGNLKKTIDEYGDIVKIVFVSENNMDNILRSVKRVYPEAYITEYNNNLYEKSIDKTINYIEIGINSTDKSDGLSKLAEALKIDNDEILAIGDGNNDVEMFKKCNKSGCLSNGTKNAKKHAKFISKYSNNNSGVADIIKYYLKEEEPDE